MPITSYPVTAVKRCFPLQEQQYGQVFLSQSPKNVWNQQKGSYRIYDFKYWDNSSFVRLTYRWDTVSLTCSWDEEVHTHIYIYA
jgi:hypothetical protein